MARAELKFLPERFKILFKSEFESSNPETLHCESIGESTRKRRRRTLLRSAAVALAGAVALASPSFGQRGSVSSGGGSHASPSSGGRGASSGGSRSSGGFGGGRSIGGGGWHGGTSSGARGGGSRTRGSGRNSPGAGGHGFSGRANGGRGWSRGYTRAGVERFDPAVGRMERVDQPKKSGFRAALHRFFGIRDSGPERYGEFARSDGGAESMVARDMERATLPPALSRVRLKEFPAFERTGSDRQISRLAPRAELRRRPVRPFPRRFGPVQAYNGWYAGYWPEFDFGFPFFFDFGYLNYCGSSACRQRNVLASPALLLYLKDGSALEVTDYWVDGVTMRYVTQDGKKGSVAVADINIQRTTEANARIGLKFRLDRTEPGLPLDEIEPSTVPSKENGVNPQVRTQK